MESLSPIDHNAHPGSNGYSSGPSDGSKSPLSMSLGFLKSLTEKKDKRVDGQTPKRRGPKPDSKPAMTRRQELNRQAQRTHRERKELYIKGLEVEVLRLKENYSAVSQSRDTLAAENQQLKLLLQQHGIKWTGSGGVDELAQNPSLGYASSRSPSNSNSYGPASTNTSPPPLNGGGYLPNQVNSFQPINGTNGVNGHQQHVLPNHQNGIDVDQAGIDFVLTLERPCMDHIQFLMDRAAEPDGEPCGHALMATCPPDAHPEDHIPFGHNLPLEGENPQKTWDVSKSDLAVLLDLSKRLQLDGEITPVMAWGMILGDMRFNEFTADDFKHMAEDLLPKIRCYGFGAVLEEFEVRDCIENYLSLKNY